MRSVGRFACAVWFRGIGDVPLLAGACVSFEFVADVMGWATHRPVDRVSEVPFTDPAAKPLVDQDGRSTRLA